MISIRQTKQFLIALIVAYIPSLFIITALLGGNGDFFDTPFAFDLLIVALYTLPILVGVIEIITCIIRIIENKKVGLLYDSIIMLIALILIVLTVISDGLNNYSLLLSALLLMIELMKWIRGSRKIIIIPFIKQLSFWIIVLALILVITLCSSIYRSFIITENKVDNLDCDKSIFNSIIYLDIPLYNQYEPQDLQFIKITTLTKNKQYDLDSCA